MLSMSTSSILTSVFAAALAVSDIFKPGVLQDALDDMNAAQQHFSIKFDRGKFYEKRGDAKRMTGDFQVISSSPGCSTCHDMHCVPCRMKF